MKTVIIAFFAFFALVWAVLCISSTLLSVEFYRTKKHDLFAIACGIALLNLFFFIISFVWFFSNLNFFFE
jgi:hypothetical protein